ncbi:MAG TPA: hypothetical protein VF970_11830 [Gemmatimonadales bacterium]
MTLPLTFDDTRPDLAMPAVHIHAGLRCVWDRWTAARVGRDRERPPLGYRLYDGNRALGTIAAPRGQPAFGPTAPTVMLIRTE